MDAYLDLLEQHEGFVPDLLLVDYVDEMKIGDPRWEGLMTAVQSLKRIARDRDMAVATVTQTKIEGAKATHVDVNHTGGSWGMIAKADVALTYSATDEEKRDGLARILVGKARTDEGRFEILISQNYAIGQFVLDSTRIGFKYKDKLKEDMD